MAVQSITNNRALQTNLHTYSLRSLKKQGNSNTFQYVTSHPHPMEQHTLQALLPRTLLKGSRGNCGHQYMYMSAGSGTPTLSQIQTTVVHMQGIWLTSVVLTLIVTVLSDTLYTSIFSGYTGLWWPVLNSRM